MAVARLLRGLGALAALLGIVVGIPVLLVALTGSPLPDTWSPASILRGLMRPDDGALLAGLVALVAWASWLVFTVSVVIELVAVLSGFRIRVSLPGLAGPQRLAAGLLLSVVTILATPPLSMATPAAGPVAESPQRPVRPAPSTGPADPAPGEPAPVPTPGQGRSSAAAPDQPVQAAPRATAHVHVVEQGDDLWTLAERYYGRGQDWRKIAAANPDRLSGGPDRLVIGWRLRIPGVEPPGVGAASETVRVESGDTLSSIADRLYGNPDRWPALYRANRDQLDDPDELPVGIQLAVPVAGQASTTEEATVWRPRAKEPTQEGSGQTGSHEAARQRVERTDTVTAARPGAGSSGETAGEADATPAAPTSTAGPVEGVGAPTGSSPEHGADDSTLPVVAGLATVGGLLAASVIAGLALRRRVQLQQRPLGRRVVHPVPSVSRVETALGHRQRPLSLRTLDLATRAVAAHCRHTGMELPALTVATVAEDLLQLTWRAASDPAPVGFESVGDCWEVRAADVGYLRSVPGLSESVRPYPALVTVGVDERGRQVVADLESLGLLTLDGPDRSRLEAALAAMAVELSFSPWADEMIVTLVGSPSRLPDALGKHNVSRTDDLDGLLDRLERRAAAQRDHQPYASPGQHRLDPDLADPWAPEIVLVAAELRPKQRRRLDDLVLGEPRVSVGAVLIGGDQRAEWHLQLDPAPSDGHSSPSARLDPAALTLVPQLLDEPAGEALADLVAITGSEQTTSAPWWANPDPDPPPDNVTYLGRRFGGWATPESDTEGRADAMDGQHQQAGQVEPGPRPAGPVCPHPILSLLGPIELAGAAGQPPPRAGKQCLEYCCWLLQNPGTTAQAMTAALVVAEGTRRSNMSRLRSWLGSDANGEPYLPDAYTGRIELHPAVSSDWQRLQILTARGVNLTSSNGLRAALELVRGAPLADAAPGQWHWAEELRTDMISAIRDIGVELAERALADHDIDLARWAAARGLVAAPGDELLTVQRIRTEHRAGNAAEVERLTLQLAAQARQLGVDLLPDTVVLLQEVMEGRVRARMA